MVSRSCVVLKSLCGRSGASGGGLWVWCGLCLGVWWCLVWLCDVLCGCLVVSVALVVWSGLVLWYGGLGVWCHFMTL